MTRTVVLFVAIAALTATACVDDVGTTVEEVAGTPDELALVRFLDDASTTVTVLDEQVPLDSRAAKGLIAHRDGKDGVRGTADDDSFDSAAEVDAVPYVGPTAMSALVSYAVAGGWVHDDEVFGTFDGVPFSVAEARAAIVLVNGATADSLKSSVGLDSRAINSIVAARPIVTMSALSKLYYVGTAMMTKIKTAVAAPAPQCSGNDDALVAQLDTAIAGMWLTSESDYPLEHASFPGRGADAGSAAAFLNVLGLPANTSMVPATLDWMVDRLNSNNDPAQVSALKQLLQRNLTHIVVWQVGLIQVHDYVVGVSPCGGIVGITSTSIET
ncbi:MAG TPA: nuclease A inhibitor family protein [Kofleriaceae bacterium]|nr:nuclease A inhibitor family protein [Kofleriaceae bacterium]